MAAKKEQRAIDRIAKFADWCIDGGLCKSMRQFETMCGLTNNHIYNAQFFSKGNVGVDIVARIHKIFPMLNITWVVIGKGKMITHVPDEGYMEAYENIKKRITDLQRIIDEMKIDTKMIPAKK